MGRRAALLLWILAAACGKPPPPPPAPPPPTPQQRLDAAKIRLLALAEQAPADAGLQRWAAALKGGDAAAPPPDPASSYEALFRARDVLRKARTQPDFWGDLTKAVDEALKRNRWDHPARAEQARVLGWLEASESDPLVRLAFRPRLASPAADVLLELVAPVEGAAFAPPDPRADAYRFADVLQKLLDDRLRSPQAVEARGAHAALERFLPAKMLLAWRRGTLPPAQEAGAALEAWGRREAALLGVDAARRARGDGTLEALFARGALVPPFGAPAAPAAAVDPDWRKEAIRDVEKNAKDLFAQEKAEAARAGPFFEEVDRRAPARAPYENLLGQALRDRDFIGGDAFPKERWEQLLDVAFPRDDRTHARGADAYGWIVRDNLRRPKTIPSSAVERRFSKKDEPMDRTVSDLDVWAVLRARKEAVGDDRRPAPEAVRKASGMQAPSLHGYGLVLAELAKAAPAQAVAWLPPAGGDVLSSGEILIAEALRGATGKDLGADWAAWKAALEGGR